MTTNTATPNTDPILTVHLQGVGLCPAIPAGQLELDTVTVWNYGYRDEVVGIEPAGSMVKLLLRSERDGIVRTRRMRTSTLVAVAR